MICKKEKCNSTEFYEKEIIDSIGRPHTQIRCKECNTWYDNKKRPENIGKTKKDFKNETMEILSGLPATDEQFQEIIGAYNKFGINRLRAKWIIDIIKGRITIPND